MKKTLLLLCLFAFAALGLQAQISTVGITQASANPGASSWSVQFRPTAGDTLLVGCNYNVGVPFNGVSDSAGDTFAQVGPEMQSSYAARTYVATNIKGGTTTVTCSASSGAENNEIYVTELKGVAAATPVDAFAATAGPRSPAKGALTTSRSGDVVWAYIVTGRASNASGWTRLSSYDGNLVSARTQSSPGTVNASFSVSMGWTLFLVALEPASGNVPDGSGSSGGTSPISVSINPSSANVQASQSAAFTAALQNDTQNQGVTWSLSGSGCSGSACGTLTNVTSSSATYNAPAAVPSPASVTLKATSVADGTKSASAAINVTAAPQPISVSVSPGSASVQVSQSAPFSATVSNDSQNKGVTWALAGSGCSGSTCGTLTNITATSAIYNAPASVPSPASVTLTARSVTDTTKSSAATITITAVAQPISVTISPASASVQTSQSTGFSSTVKNDSQNKGVSWSLSGASCSGTNCGTLTSVTTTSVTYNAPSSVPSSSVALTATSVSDSTKSASATITVTSPTPTAPGNLTTNATSSSQIALSWSASTDTLGIASYLIERCQNAGCSNFAQIASTASTAYNDTAVSASTAYSYRVRAEDTGNNLGPYSSTASATTPASSGGGSGSGSGPTLVWSKSSANSTGVSMSSFISNLPTAGTLTGNVLIATFQYSAGSGASAHVTDDKGDTMALIATNNDGNQVLSTYCVVPAPGARVLTISFSGGMPQWVSMVNASEWYNLTCSLDGSSVNTGFTSSITAGNITTTTDGDLLYQAAIEDGGTYSETWTGSAPWALLSAERGVGGVSTPQAAQYQIQATHGSINSTASMNSADSWNTVAVALKAAAAGTVPPAGMRIVHMQEEAIIAGENGPFVLQFPSSGNLIISASNDGPQFDVAGIRDGNGNSYTQIGAAFSDGTGSGSGDLQTFYAANAVTSTNMSITYSMTGNPLGGSTFFLYDVTGASSSPYDATAGRKTITASQTSPGNITGPTITPTSPGELVITQIGVNSNSVVNVSPGYFAGTIPNPLPQTNNTNENNGWGFDFPAASPRTYIWSTQGGPVYGWASTAVAFMAP